MPVLQPDEHAAGTVAARPRWPVVAISCLLLLVGWESVATWRQHADAVSEQDWHAAVALLRKHYRAGDPVLIAPEWAEPTARAHLGGIVDLDLATLSDVDRYARVWELSIRGARHRWLKGLTPRRRWTPSRVSLSLFEKPPVTVLTDFRQRLAQANVALVGTRRRSCPRRGRRFVCGSADWDWVGDKIAEVNHRAYRCIYAHPHTGATLRVAFANVTLGSRLVGYTGIDDFASRRSASAPVYLQLVIDGELQRSVKQPNEGHWRRFEVDTAKLAGAGHHVRFEISTDDDAHRTFCFHAEVRR